MLNRIFLLILICFVCTGCKTLEVFQRGKKAGPAVLASKPVIETETLWVPAKTKKVWVNSHVDDDGNMIDGHYKHIITEEGHWTLQEIPPAVPETTKTEAEKSE